MARFLERLREVTANLIAESGEAATYIRQLLRGNHGLHAAAEGPPAAAPTTQPRSPVPVLLLQGFLANRGSVHLLARRLHELSHVVMTYRLGRLNTGDIRTTAALVARKVDSLTTQTHLDRVDIIGHSMGGLVALYYVKCLGGHRHVRRLILLGTPAAGTWSAVMGMVAAPFGTAGRQLLPGSAFLRELAAAPWPRGVELHTVAGRNDFFAPLRATLLTEAHHLTLPSNHAGLLVRKDVAHALDKLLRDAPKSPPGAGSFVDGARLAP